MGKFLDWVHWANGIEPIDRTQFNRKTLICRLTTRVKMKMTHWYLGAGEESVIPSVRVLGGDDSPRVHKSGQLRVPPI